jgi:hypothetical protein
MKITNFFLSGLIFSFSFSILFSISAWSWGGRGHHTICDAAVFLMKDSSLKTYLMSKPHVMGHLCNVPDIYWKSLSGDARQYGDPTHYTNPEITGYTIQNLPSDLKKLIEEKNGTKNAFDGKNIRFLPNDMGTIWWRADQFYRRAIAEKDGLASAKPQGRNEEQDDNQTYNKAAYNFLVNLGVMGHFIGDASQPFHNSADHDGYKLGHGGIHSYYEDALVSAIDFNLMSAVVQKGKSLQKDKKIDFLSSAAKPDTAHTIVFEKIRKLSQVSRTEVDKVIALDKVIKASSLKEERGMSLRTPAERKEAQTVYKKFEPLITLQMARAAALLAQVWDSAYVEAGSPDFKSYKSYKYPFTPDFVAPDYFEIPAAKKTEK